MLLKAGACDEDMREKIKTRRLNRMRYMEIIQDVDKQFSQWRVKPIIIPSYNFLGKGTRLDWTENRVSGAILTREKKVTLAPHFSS